MAKSRSKTKSIPAPAAKAAPAPVVVAATNDVQATPALAKAERPSHDVIAQRAYELWLARGGVHGDSMGDWLRAEREVSAA